MILKRHEKWPEERISTVIRAWEGRTVACIATGPSLSQAQVDAVRAADVPAITVNDAYLLAPWAEAVYFADVKWWKWHKDRPEWKSFVGQKCSIHMGASVANCGDKEIHMLRNASHDPRFEGMALSTDPNYVVTGANSGYQAMNIAVLAGAKRIVMLGYDCRDVGKAAHFFGEHPDGTKPPYASIKHVFSQMAAAAKPLGVEIVNATPESAIECFPMVSLAEGLQPHP